MISEVYSRLVRYKQWADSGLNDVIAANRDRLDAESASIIVRVLDHIHVVDRIFRRHLLGLPPGFAAPRSAELPTFEALASGMREVDDWYVSHVESSAAAAFDQPVDFDYTNGSPARMRRGEMILHVCLHGTYHRGNAGILLQKNGITPNGDRMTDFLEQ